MAVSVSGPSVRMTDDLIATAASALRAAAGQLSQLGMADAGEPAR